MWEVLVIVFVAGLVWADREARKERERESHSKIINRLKV